MADGTINESDFSEQHKIENDEETEKPNAAIEHFDSNQEAVKTKLNELLREIDDDLEVEETGQKMYEVMNDSEMEDDVQKHLNQCWLDHHLYLLQLSSDGSDLDLGNSENDEDLMIKKQSDQENQGTTANAEFTDQDRNDKAEDEITAKISEVSSLVQDKSEKNKEENEKLTAAIQQFDSDQESFKKKLNELSTEFDDNLKHVDLEVEETEQKMTGMFNESKMADDVEKHLDKLRLKFDLQFQSSSDDGSDLNIENSENVEDYVGNLKIKKQSDQENQETIANAEFTDQDRSEKV
ncbi:unnamed protein product [Ilex paraguariensis]|uniref:Uncharacterized protein n=1 Tax=Ilex paraguariensis TaxID=185542 RepID=A0ABC8TN22_9AQUA